MKETQKIIYNFYFDAEKVKVIKEKSIALYKAYNAMDKASKAEYKSNAQRTGKRGGKFTTLEAKSMNATRIYLQIAEELKYMVVNL